MILYVAELSQRLCYSTIQSYLSAVRHLHLTTGHKDPLKDTVQLELVLKGVKRWRPRSERHRLPITPYILNTMLTVLLQNPQEYNNIVLWAACCLGFFAFLSGQENSLHQPPPLIQPGTCHPRISWLTAMQPLLCLK